MEAGIRVVAVGEVETQVLEHIRSALQEAFLRECRLGEGLPKPEYAYNPRRGQYSAKEILQHLRLYGAERVLFVFGLADPFGGGAAIALPRLRQEYYGLPKDRILFLQRVVKEAVHELGHTYGLRHCNNRNCVMAFSNSLVDTDYKSAEFCEKCQSKLR
jgi:archaemetzincin